MENTAPRIEPHEYEAVMFAYDVFTNTDATERDRERAAGRLQQLLAGWSPDYDTWLEIEAERKRAIESGDYTPGAGKKGLFGKIKL